MQIFELSAHQSEEVNDSDEGFRFEKSLQELRDLRSQLHYAAEYCETTFLNAQEKRAVVENTKEYICRAVVTFVDHLGSVSSNLDHCISKTNSFSEAELRINCLKQRLLSCEQYAHKLALTRLRWNPVLPRHHRRYLTTPQTNAEGSNEELSRDSIAAGRAKAKLIDNRDGDLPLFLYTYPVSDKPSSVKIPPWKGIGKKTGSSSASVVPVRDGLSILSKGLNPTFHFQLGAQKLGRRGFYRKYRQSSDILSLIRRAKRAAA